MQELFTCTYLIFVLLQYKSSLAGYTNNVTDTANNLTETAHNMSETEHNVTKTTNNITKAANNTSETAINISETAESFKKLSQVDESTLGLGKEDMIVIKKKEPEDSWKQEILDILTEICGEPYRSCSVEFLGFKTFKKTSVCKSCSCNAYECQISKNCCPDVEIDYSYGRRDDTILKPVCASLSDKVSGHKLELVSNQSHQNNQPVTQASLKVHVNVQSDNKADEGEITKETKSELTTQTLTEDYLKLSDVWNGTTDKFDQSVNMNMNKTKTTRNTQISNDSQPQNENNSETGKSSPASVLADSIFLKYLVTDFCPSEYLDSDVIARCNNKASNLLLDYIPVSNMYGSKIYANKWCAQCHNVSVSKSWRLETDCLQLYPMDYLPSMITDFHALTKNCTVRLLPPRYLETANQLCHSLPTYNIIDKCNVTGLWKKNNTLIHDLCAQRDSVPYYTDRQKAQTTIYKNIFCYICNTFGNLNISRDTMDERETDFTFGERKLVLEASVDKADTLSQGWSLENNKEQSCPKGTILDIYSGDCVQFECPIHQRAMGNICLNRDIDVRGLVLAATVYLKFQRPVYIGETLNEITESGKQIIQTIDKQMFISDSGCDIRYIQVFGNFYESSRGYIKEMFLESKIANTRKCSVDNLVLIYTKLNDGKFDISFKVKNETKLSKHPSLLSSKLNYKATTMLSFKPNDNHTIEIILIQKPIFYDIRLSEKFYCPRLLFNLSKYTEHGKQNRLVPICYSQYVKSWLMKMYRTSSIKPNQNSLAVTLSIVSTTVSMISSILILTTYSIFQELRFVPGKLLMLLCCNLLLAQGFYTFGMGSDLGTISCKLVGICIHFFWLTTMFCMNSNLWLMLIHMEAPLERRSMKFIHSQSNLPVIKYSCYCYGMASMCVLTNIILSYSIYQDKDYGYGGTLCYIKSRQMKVFTFALPIALVLLINFFMFCRIMTKISKTVQNKYTRVLKARMLVFLKLSTITGFYWTFGFIFESTKVQAFEYLFIVLNGGQGFFLMWSFMLNKRVFELYKNIYQKICFKESKNQLKSGSVACQEI